MDTDDRNSDEDENKKIEQDPTPGQSQPREIQRKYMPPRQAYSNVNENGMITFA